MLLLTILSSGCSRTESETTVAESVVAAPRAVGEAIMTTPETVTGALADVMTMFSADELETEVRAYQPLDTDLNESIRRQSIMAENIEQLNRDPDVKARIDFPEPDFTLQPDFQPMQYDPKKIPEMNVSEMLPQVELEVVNTFFSGNRLQVNIVASNMSEKQGNKTISIWTFDDTGRLVSSESKTQHFRPNQKLFLQYSFPNTPQNARWVMRVHD